MPLYCISENTFSDISKRSGSFTYINKFYFILQVYTHKKKDICTFLDLGICLVSNSGVVTKLTGLHHP